MREFSRMRTWAGALTIGSFGVVGTTGILMFFHLNGGLSKLAHEWLGWLLVIAVVVHVAVNWKPFVSYFRRPLSIAIMAVLLVLGGLSFLSGGSSGGRHHPMMGAMLALEQSSLKVVAEVGKQTPDSLIAALRAREIRVRDDQQTIREVASENHMRSLEILGYILGDMPQSAADQHSRD